MDKIKKATSNTDKRTLIIVTVVVFIILCICCSGIIGVFVYTNSRNGTNGDYFDFGQSGDEIKEEVNTCTLPTVNFKESAFSIGVPKDWIYEVDNGTVAIMEDEQNTTAAFIYTARLEQDLSAKEFLSEFAKVFDTLITDAGGEFNLGTINEQNNVAMASVEATVAEGDLTGKFQVDKDADFVTLRVYWAPKAEFSQNEPLLQQVVGCFHRQKLLTDEILSAVDTEGTPSTNKEPTKFSAYNGQYFKLQLPEGYKVTGETDSGVDISRADDKAGFSYAYATGAQGPYNPESWVRNAFPQYLGMTNLQLSNATDITSPIAGYTIQEFEYTGTLNGTTPIQGRTTVGVYNTPDYGFGVSSSVFWAVQIATPEVWPSVSADLQTLQNSVEITNLGSRNDVVLPPNRPIDSVGGDSITSSYEYKNSVSDQANDNWSDAMRGYEPVQSPSTGDKYDAPLNSWNSTGPDGPGYYRPLPGGGVEKLEPAE